jgi:threonine dehydrogenase-like Zn-dependent dehydrogenase
MKALVYRGARSVALEQVPDAYRHFDQGDEGWTKVVLHP